MVCRQFDCSRVAAQVLRPERQLLGADVFQIVILPFREIAVLNGELGNLRLLLSAEAPIKLAQVPEENLEGFFVRNEVMHFDDQDMLVPLEPKEGKAKQRVLRAPTGRIQ